MASPEDIKRAEATFSAVRNNSSRDNPIDATLRIIARADIIRSNQQKTQSLKQFDKDYDDLAEVIKTLPDKLTHQIMVPIGKKAFFPGYIEHSNEITVLLGDNWFIQCTAKHALGIIKRRQDYIKKQLNDLQKEFKLLQDRVGLTNELLDFDEGAVNRGGFVEIRERLDEDKPATELKLPNTAPQSSKKPIIEVVESKAVSDEGEGEEEEHIEIEEHPASESVEEETEEYFDNERDRTEYLFAKDEKQWEGLSTDEMLKKAMELEDAIQSGKVTASDAPAQARSNSSVFGDVVERVPEAEITPPKPPEATTSSSKQDNPPKRVSRFKAERSK